MSLQLRTFHQSGRAAPWVLGLVAILAACLVALVVLVYWHDHPLPLPASHPAQQVSLPPAQPPAGLSFSTLLTSQSAGAPEGLLVAGGRWSVNRRPVQFAVLIRHPQGNLLFDTGLGCDHAEQFAANNAVHRQLFAYTMNAAVKTQLEQHGMADLPLRWIIPSHMHWDHASGIPDFPQAEVWATRSEYDFAHQPSRPVRLPLDRGVKWRLFDFPDRPYENFARSLDLFGDGRLVLVPLPGHTPGGVGLFANLASGKRLFFTGDVTWLKEGFDHRVGKSWLASRIVDTDRDLTHRSIEQVADLLKQKPEIVVVPAHDARAQAALARFPRYED